MIHIYGNTYDKQSREYSCTVVVSSTRVETVEWGEEETSTGDGGGAGRKVIDGACALEADARSPTGRLQLQILLRTRDVSCTEVRETSKRASRGSRRGD